MKQISSGWQYRVYDLGNGRVRKIERSLLDSFYCVFFTESSKFYHRPMKSFQEARRLGRENLKTINRLKEILSVIPPQLFGNIKFLGGADYEQDLACPLGEYFRDHSPDENKKAIAGYVELVLKLWRYGCSDTIFNFTLNSAIDSNNRVIQIDIRELAFDKEAVINDIKTKKWLMQASHSFLEDLELKKFFREEMDRFATLENLDNNWKYEQKL